MQAILGLFLLGVAGVNADEMGTVYYVGGKYQLKLGLVDPTGVAFGTFADTLNVTGWGVLTLQTNPSFSDSSQMYAAGYLEGALTSERIYQMSENMYEYFFDPPNYQPPPSLVQWFQVQENWTNTMVAQNPTDPFWQFVGFIQNQFDGLVQGYTDYHNPSQFLDRTAFSVLNGVGDLLDLMNVLNITQPKPFNEMTPQEFKEYAFTHSLCSGFIKVTGDLGNLFAAHSSWFTYSATNRIFKYYNFQLNAQQTACRKMAFSSYPGFLESLDDFYIMDSGLVMVQTTNGIYNYSLYDIVVPQSLFAWQRVRVANGMSTNGPQWYQLLSMYNSGTYNNQYMVVNYNLYTPQQQLQNNTLFVCEQIPGLVVGADLTDQLERGYFASYNVPYFYEIYTLSGYPEIVAQFGNDYSYQLAPRAKIFRRDQGNVIDFNSLKYLMRYNDYKFDPYSEGDPMNAICSRGDLETVNATAFGCYDSKCTNQDMMTSLSAYIINGPTTQGLPPFSWVPPFSNTTAHYGEPTTYNFPWEQISPSFWS